MYVHVWSSEVELSVTESLGKLQLWQSALGSILEELTWSVRNHFSTEIQFP